MITIFGEENCVDVNTNAKGIECLDRCSSFYLYCCQNLKKLLEKRKSEKNEHHQNSAESCLRFYNTRD